VLGRLHLRIDEDGRGIDVEKVRRRAIERGLLVEMVAEDLPAERIRELIFEPGISTKDEVSEVSGRGVGLDVVKRQVEALGGAIAVNSETGKGTSFLLDLPSMVTMQRVLVLQVGGQRVALPILSIEAVLSAGEAAVERAGVDAQLIDYPPPAPLAALWGRPDLGCAFMCGYPYARAIPKPALLAAPLPSARAYGGRPRYWSNLIVRADAPFAALPDVFGHRIAYTTEDSQSGYQAARELLAPHAQTRGGPLFAATVGPLITPRRLVEAVLAGEADVAPLDSYAHDLIRAHEPDRAARLRTLVATIPAPIPPLVASPNLPLADAERLRAALLYVGQAPELASIRGALLLEGFVAPASEDYAVLLERAGEADRLGYPRLA